jgi:hypothetical protein
MIKGALPRNVARKLFGFSRWQHAGLATLAEIHPAALGIGAMDNASTGIETHRLVRRQHRRPVYGGARRRYKSWCVQKQVCPRSCRVNKQCDFSLNQVPANPGWIRADGLCTTGRPPRYSEATLSGALLPLRYRKENAGVRCYCTIP